MPKLQRDAADKLVGQRIRQYRIHSGLSQEILGKMMGITFQQIQKYENGYNRIASTRIIALCKIFKVTPNDLFGYWEHDEHPKLPKPPELSNWATRYALEVDRVPVADRGVFVALLDAFAPRLSRDVIAPDHETDIADEPVHTRVRKPIREITVSRRRRHA